LTGGGRLLSVLGACAALFAATARGEPAGAERAASTPAANPAEALELPTVSVIGTTPLPGLGTPVEDVPANVQVYTGEAMAREHHSALTDYLTQ
jgi:outer membrane receptor protein involved in Fe transport